MESGIQPEYMEFYRQYAKGVTIHMISAGLDEGDILFQEETYFDSQVETFQTTHTKLNEMITDLSWPIIYSGQYKALRKK